MPEHVRVVDKECEDIINAFWPKRRNGLLKYTMDTVEDRYDFNRAMSEAQTVLINRYMPGYDEVKRERALKILKLLGQSDSLR